MGVDRSAVGSCDRPVLSFPDFIRSCVPVDEPLPARFQQARRSSSVYTKLIPDQTSEEPMPKISASPFYLQDSAYSSSDPHMLDSKPVKPSTSRLKKGSLPVPIENNAHDTDGSEGISPSTRLMPEPKRRYPHGLASPDISPLMIPTVSTRRISSNSQLDRPPPEAYLGAEYTPPPDTFYPEDVLTEAFDEPLFAEHAVTSSPESMSASSQQMNPLLFCRQHNKAHEALGISPHKTSHRESRRRTSSNHSHGYNRFRAALRSISREEVHSASVLPTRRSTQSTTSRISLPSASAISSKVSVVGMKELLVDDYHKSVSEQARREREASISSTTVKEQMRMIPAPLFLKNGSMRPPTENDSASQWSAFRVSSDRPKIERVSTAPTSPIGRVRNVLPTRMFSTRGQRSTKEREPVRPQSDRSSSSTTNTSPSTPTSSRPSRSTTPSTVASPLTPTLTTRDPPARNRSLTSPRRLFVNAAPMMFRSSSKKLQKSPRISSKKSGDDERGSDGKQKSKENTEQANDMWRQQIKRTIKVVGEKDPNELGVEQRESKLPKKSEKSKKYNARGSESVAVRDHLGWDRGRSKTTK